MSLRGQIKKLLSEWKSQNNRRLHDESLIRIYEGDLKGELVEFIKKDMPNTWDRLVGRIAPINVLKRLNDKLSKIYQQNVIRMPAQASTTASDLLSWYEMSMEANVYFNISNELFNLTKNCLVQPFVYQTKPRMRTIDSTKFAVLSEDPVDNTRPTHVILYMGKLPTGRDYFYAYTDTEFVAFDDNEEILTRHMEDIGNPEGINPIGRIPFVYCKRSRSKLIPTSDSDLLQMSLIIPLLLSDLNYAIKWQAYSIIVFMNAKPNNLVRDAAAIWELHSDPETPDLKPGIDTIKPDIDINSVLQNTAEQLGLWLQTQGVKPGAVGRLSGDNFSSGVSKLIDEMDTYENRLVQVDYYKGYEREFWDLTLNYLHPYWLSKQAVTAAAWPGGDVDTDFPKQLPMESRRDVIGTVKEEMELGLLRRVDALKRLNPGWSTEKCEEYLTQVEQEKKERAESFGLPTSNGTASNAGRSPEEGEYSEDDEPEVDESGSEKA
jgi:hypothetical protein